MAYPDGIDQFPEKLNKKQDGVYVIEEEITLTDGQFEGLLAHDNIINSTVKVYTGSKFTGKEVTTWTLSIPAETPWRRHIKIFADTEKVYVTYETPGDTVEADDVNVLQVAITATQSEIDRYKAANDAVVNDIDSRLSTVEANKAEKTYVDSQLLLKADKANTYTKAETDQRIQNIIGAAPDALDTLQEIAEALNNDPDFAATITNQLSTKVDKVPGKQLSTEDYTTAEKTKLAGIAAGAGTPNSATDIVIGTRTISDANAPTGDSGTITTLFGWIAYMIKAITGKANWRTAPSRNLEDLHQHIGSGGSSHAAATASTAGFMSAEDKTKLDGIQPGANNYVHPTGDGNLHVPATGTTNNGKVLKAGASAGSIAWGNVDWSELSGKPSTFPPSAHTHAATDIVESSTKRFVTDAEKATWNAKQNALGYTPENVANKGKAGGYAELDSNGKIPDNRISSTFVTQEQLGEAGFGDMLKSIYDTDNDGKVDAAESADSVPWTGVTGKPSTFSPQAHANSHASGGGDPVTPSMIGAVSKSGDTMSGDLTFQGRSIRINRPNTTNAWARGIHYHSKDGVTTEAGLGFYGVGDSEPQYFYVGFGTSPWSGGIVVRPTEIYFKSKKIWHEENDGSGSGLDADKLDGKHATDFMSKGPVTWNQLKGV